MASGTISGPEKSSYGSMLELSWAGTKPITLEDGSTRKFILDGDTVTMRAYGEKGTIRVGFGEVSTKILPKPYSFENKQLPSFGKIVANGKGHLMSK